jgi:hypothetical protein
MVAVTNLPRLLLRALVANSRVRSAESSDRIAETYRVFAAKAPRALFLLDAVRAKQVSAQIRSVSPQIQLKKLTATHPKVVWSWQE